VIVGGVIMDPPPPAQEIVRLVNEAHARYKSNTDGKNSQVYPALVRALKIGLLFMAGLAMLGIFPAGQLPDYIPRVIPDPDNAPVRPGNRD